MREAVIVSYARTGLAKSHRGGFNNTPAMTMAAHAIKHAVAKSGVDPEAVEDVYLGNGAHGAGNLGRLAGLLAGLPITTGGATDPAPLLVGPERDRPGRQLHQAGRRRRRRRRRRRVDLDAEPRLGGPATWTRALEAEYPAIFMAMIDTADIVAERYNVSRECQDEYSLQSPAAHGRRAGRRPVRGRDRADGHDDEARQQGDEGRVVRRLRRRPRRVQPSRARRSKAWPSSQPVQGEGNFITAGNASQLSDGAAAVVMMEADGGRAPRPRADGRVQGLGRRRLRARRDGHRSRVRRAPPARAPRPQGRRHRPVGAERGVRQPVPLLPRPPRHRPREVQRQRRLDRRSATRSA